MNLLGKIFDLDVTVQETAYLIDQARRWRLMIAMQAKGIASAVDLIARLTHQPLDLTWHLKAQELDALAAAESAPALLTPDEAFVFGLSPISLSAFSLGLARLGDWLFGLQGTLVLHYLLINQSRRFRVLVAKNAQIIAANSTRIADLTHTLPPLGIQLDAIKLQHLAQLNPA
jgi:hypothetical protein